MMRIFKFIGAFIVALTIGASFTACSDDIDKSNRYTFTGETIADFILNREDRFSKMITILKQADMLGLLSTYGTYTFFLPGDEAIDTYLREQFEAWDSTKNDPNPSWTGITSPFLEDLSDSMAVVIAKTHIVPYGYEMAEMSEGVIDTRNYNDRYLSVSFVTVDENFRIMINNQAGIIEGDNLVENGVVHIVDEAVTPSTNSVPKLIADQPYFSLMSAALQETGFDKKLQNYILQLNGEDYKLGSEPANCFQCGKGMARYPHSYYIKYTGFIETDDVYASEGIYTLDDLKAYAEKYYGTEDRDNPQSEKNALYKFVAYHFLERELNYNLMIQHNLEHSSYKSEGTTGLLPDVDRSDYFETMLGTLIKVTKPLGSLDANEVQNLYLNYSHNPARQSNMRKNINICIYDITTFTSLDEKYANFSANGMNGIIHPIDKILIYNEDEMKGNVLNERMRFDIASLLPELTNNGVRYGRWSQTGGACSHGDYNVPNGYCKNIKINEPTTEWHYFCPHSWGANYLGDEIIVVGQYDFEYRLPPVPEGTYELRLGYTATSIRAITQFYVDGKVTGIPVDLRIFFNDERIGWIEDKKTDDDGVENDKTMRNHGYMKAPASYYCQHSGGTLARNYNGAGRIIITQKTFGGANHWMRMKKVDEPLDREFNHDYIELVPKSVVTSHIPEDRY
ncbi:MAG: fasciclin domain-containing protein [Bacteroidaceae bacterium]|nr:fasciclin domain-containing protein [Bacteroidaceae bacterium]